VLLIRRFPIGHLERPFIRKPEYVLQQLYFGDDLLGVLMPVATVGFRPRKTSG
jgi:hypothetical protein